MGNLKCKYCSEDMQIIGFEESDEFQKYIWWCCICGTRAVEIIDIMTKEKTLKYHIPKMTREAEGDKRQ